MCDGLRRLKVQHETVLGRLPTANDRIFLSPEGCAWKRPTTNPMRILHRLLLAARIPRINPQGERIDIHGLRHSAATRFARNGVPLIHTQRILGHSDPKLTAAVYTHLDAEDLRGAVETLDVPARARQKEAL